jgi:hypothetical protein
MSWLQPRIPAVTVLAGAVVAVVLIVVSSLRYPDIFLAVVATITAGVLAAARARRADTAWQAGLTRASDPLSGGHRDLVRHPGPFGKKIKDLIPNGPLRLPSRYCCARLRTALRFTLDFHGRRKDARLS